MATDNRGRSNSPRPRPWSAAESDRCECVLAVKLDDVLLGRGSGPNDHVGNIKFRDLVHDRKAEYLSTNHRQTKAMIAKDIVDQVYARGGRFLKKLSPVESAKKLPGLLAKNADGPENDRSNDMDSSGPCDVYQIQKHATVMEKAKQALRQNQRNGSLEPPESRASPNIESRRGSLGQSSVSSDHQPHNWGGMQMGNMNIPTTLNNSQHGNLNGQRHHGGGYQNNNIQDSFDQNQNFKNSSHGRNQDHHQQLYQQQQDLMNLQKQHDLLQQQMQYQQQRHQNQQYQSQQMEMETHNQLLQEQLELQIRQEQLRQLQQQHMQKFANSMAMYKNQQDGNSDRPHQMQGQSPNSPPAVLNGYATYTTTLDAIEDGRQNSTDGLADPNDMMPNDANNSLSNISDGSKLHEKFDDKSMQMSTMMGSFKDLSVHGEHSMHGSGDTVGTIDNIPSSLAGLSMVHMSGISIMSMMNDSSDSLFKNPHKAGNDVGAKNASWGSTGSPSNATPNSSQAPLADVVESANPAAIAAAAVLGKNVPGMERAQRRWSGGFMPPTEISAVRRVNRRGSLQYTSNNQESNQVNNMDNMATANAMLQMAHNQQLQQSQNFNHYNNSGNGQGMGYGGGQNMMNTSNQQYMMENGAYDNQGDSNMAFHNN